MCLPGGVLSPGAYYGEGLDLRPIGGRLGLPQPVYPIAIEFCVDRDYRQIVPQCLGDQHSIEGVTVMARQASGTFSIGNANR